MDWPPRDSARGSVSTLWKQKFAEKLYILIENKANYCPNETTYMYIYIDRSQG